MKIKYIVATGIIMVGSLGLNNKANAAFKNRLVNAVKGIVTKGNYKTSSLTENVIIKASSKPKIKDLIKSGHVTGVSGEEFDFSDLKTVEPDTYYHQRFDNEGYKITLDSVNKPKIKYKNGKLEVKYLSTNGYEYKDDPEEFPIWLRGIDIFNSDDYTTPIAESNLDTTNYDKTGAKPKKKLQMKLNLNNEKGLKKLDLVTLKDTDESKGYKKLEVSSSISSIDEIEEKDLKTLNIPLVDSSSSDEDIDTPKVIGTPLTISTSVESITSSSYYEKLGAKPKKKAQVKLNLNNEKGLKKLDLVTLKDTYESKGYKKLDHKSKDTGSKEDVLGASAPLTLDDNNYLNVTSIESHSKKESSILGKLKKKLKIRSRSNSDLSLNKNKNGKFPVQLNKLNLKTSKYNDNSDGSSENLLDKED